MYVFTYVCMYACMCYTVRKETEMKQVRGGLTLVDAQMGPLRRLYSRRRLGATLLVMPSLPPSDSLDQLSWNTPLGTNQSGAEAQKACKTRPSDSTTGLNVIDEQCSSIRTERGYSRKT